MYIILPKLNQYYEFYIQLAHRQTTLCFGCFCKYFQGSGNFWDYISHSEVTNGKTQIWHAPSPK